MDENKVKQIIRIFEASSLSKLALEVDDIKISMEKPTVSQVCETVKHDNVKEVKAEVVDGQWVKAPFVGTYYSAASENSKPYIEVGQKVQAGATICLLEAMKVLNEIKAPISGTVKEIRAKNAAMVESGQELVLIGD